MKIGVLGWRLSGTQSGAYAAHLDLAQFLVERGHEVRCAALRGRRSTRHGQAVSIGVGAARSVSAWADVVLLRDEPKIARVLPYCARRRTVYVCHSPAGAPAELRLNLPRTTTVVYASAACKAATEALHGPQPGVVVEGYPMRFAAVEPGDDVTLVNLSARKGGPLFWQLASLMPDVPFVGVRSWDEQIVPDDVPPNVTLLDNQGDVREVYGRTRILLVPSAAPGTVASDHLPAWGECWNRVSVEAAACGIPVIAHPSAGVRASIGTAATYVHRDDVDGWVRAIRALDDPAVMTRHRAASLERAAEIEAAFDATLAAYEAVIAPKRARAA